MTNLERLWSLPVTHLQKPLALLENKTNKEMLPHQSNESLINETQLRGDCISYIVYAKATINCNNLLSSSDRMVSLFLWLFEEIEEKKRIFQGNLDRL